MRGHRAVMVVAGAAAVWCAAAQAVTAAPAARAAAQAGTWGTAIEVPGLGALNQGGAAELTSVSCGAAGNCAAAGSYTDGGGYTHAFVAGETNGKWRKAIKIPGLDALTPARADSVDSVSCASAGNCAALGRYADGTGRRQVFVVSQTNGTWGQAIRVPGTGGLNKGGAISPALVSCASAGNCAAVGDYVDGRGHVQVFVASQTNGTWGKAIRMPVSGLLDWGGSAFVLSVSCGAAGNCAAGGAYRDNKRGHMHAFVVNLTNGTWGTAIEVPGAATLNTGGDASVDSVSCVSAGNCTAVGNYRDGTDPLPPLRPFAVRQTNGTWGQAITAPGAGLLNTGGFASVNSVSCATPGNCAAGGFYQDSAKGVQAFVISEKNGTWGTAIEVPGSGALNGERSATVESVSCPSAGNCAAGGTYTDASGHTQALVVSQTAGAWGNAIQVPGTGTLNAGDATITSVSCRSAGRCAAGGTYTDASGHIQAFVVNQA